MNRFSTGIATGDVTRDRLAGVTGENCQKTIFDCAAVAEINSKMPSGHLLQFALPCGKKSKIFQIFSSLPLLSGSAVYPKNVVKNDDFYRAIFLL